MINIKERKIGVAFGFLSLDLVVAFAGELEAPWAASGELQMQLRNALDIYVKNASFYELLAMVNVDVYKSIDDKFGMDQREAILKWVEGVYMHFGEDRRSESVWALILARGCSSQESSHIDAQLFGRLCNISKAIQKNRVFVKSKIAVAKTKTLCAWDKAMLSIMDSNADLIYDKIILMSTYNVLVKQWQVEGITSLAELQAVLEWGNYIGSLINMPQRHIVLPGNWNNGVTHLGVV